MTKVAVYNLSGEKVRDIELSDAVFAVKAKEDVLHQVVVAQRENARVVLSHTKGRSEVRGGGKKPWKQKGTGRARHGSSRSPIWVGGGITFGPTKDKTFNQKVNKKVKRVALQMCLSDKVFSEALTVVEDLKVSGKTKDFTGILDKLKLNNKKILVASDAGNTEIVRAGRNIPKVKIIGTNSLNVVDLLNYESLLVTEAGIRAIESLYGVIDKKDNK